MKEFRILLVDDNPDHVFLIKRALDELTDMDLRVEVAADGEEAMAFLRQQGRFADRALPHMVLLDLRMPRKGGLEVLEDMRSDDALRPIPVCVLTSSDRDEDIRSAYHLGTNAYVVKSGDADALRREITGIRDFWTTVSRVPEPSP